MHSQPDLHNSMITWINLMRGRYIGNKFDIDQIGYVPWRGTLNAVGINWTALAI